MPSDPGLREVIEHIGRTVGSRDPEQSLEIPPPQKIEAADDDEDGETKDPYIGTTFDHRYKIEELLGASNGGFGAFLLLDHNWARPAAKMHSYELFAQYVMPHFTGQLAGPAASCDWVRGSGTMFMERAAHAIGKAIEDHAAERAERS